MPVEPGLADQEAQPGAELVTGGLDPGPYGGDVGSGLSGHGRATDARGGAVLAEDLAQRPGPLAGGHAGPGAHQGGGHEVALGLGRVAQRQQRLLDGSGVTVRPPGPDRGDRLALDLGVDGHDGTVDIGEQRVGLGGGEAVDPDDDVLSGLDAAAALGVRADQGGLHVIDGLDRAAEGLHLVDLGLDLLAQGSHLGLHHDGAGEQVVVLEQVGLEGQHLLQSQRPLLVPWAGQPQGLVPRRQLDGPGPGVLAQGHPEHLQHDSLDVVLGLGLREAQRVDLDAVPEPALLGVLHAVPLQQQRVPELREGAHLAHFFDKPDPGVDEETDPRADLAEALLGHLAAGFDGVQDGDGGAQREGDLLDGCRPGLLQVVAADVDRVPLGDLRDRVGNHVGDEPQRRAGWEDVGPPRQVLLDDVVLRRPGQLSGYGALLLGGDLVEREQPHRGRVDGHGGVHVGEGDAVKQRPHVAEVAHGDTDLADLAAGQLVVGVVARLGRQVEGHRQPGLALGQVGPVELVALGRRAVAGVGPHHPRLVARGPAGRRCVLRHRGCLSLTRARGTVVAAYRRLHSPAQVSRRRSTTGAQQPVRRGPVAGDEPGARRPDQCCPDLGRGRRRVGPQPERRGACDGR